MPEATAASKDGSDLVEKGFAIVIAQAYALIAVLRDRQAPTNQALWAYVITSACTFLAGLWVYYSVSHAESKTQGAPDIVTRKFDKGTLMGVRGFLFAAFLIPWTIYGLAQAGELPGMERKSIETPLVDIEVRETDPPIPTPAVAEIPGDPNSTFADTDQRIHVKVFFGPQTFKTKTPEKMSAFVSIDGRFINDWQLTSFAVYQDRQVVEAKRHRGGAAIDPNADDEPEAQAQSHRITLRKLDPKIQYVMVFDYSQRKTPQSAAEQRSRIESGLSLLRNRDARGFTVVAVSMEDEQPLATKNP